ncbi:MAG: epoxyqueuosine reductase QueH [Dysosmobacter welbionis]
MERVLLHTCCAPCSLSCIEPLRSEGIEPVAFWYNPNIHPWKEYQARRDCLLAYAPTIGMEVRVQEDYGLKDFVRHVAGDIDHRCAYCYEHRLEGTAKYAAEHGFAAFTSTLLASTYQNHEAIAAAAEMYARQYGGISLPGLPVKLRAGNQRARSWGSICRSTAAASFPRRTAIRSRSTGTGQNLTRRRRPDRADELPFDAQKRPARQLPRRSFLPFETQGFRICGYRPATR